MKRVATCPQQLELAEVLRTGPFGLQISSQASGDPFQRATFARRGGISEGKLIRRLSFLLRTTGQPSALPRRLSGQYPTIWLPPCSRSGPCVRIWRFGILTLESGRSSESLKLLDKSALKTQQDFLARTTRSIQRYSLERKGAGIRIHAYVLFRIFLDVRR